MKCSKEFFLKKQSRFRSADEVYTQLKKMILSGKLKKGQKLIQEEIAYTFNVSKNAGEHSIFPTEERKVNNCQKQSRGIGCLIFKNIYIFKFIQRVMRAHFLGKMLEIASINRKRVHFHNYSTSFVD